MPPEAGFVRRLIDCRETGQSRGFGFVTMGNVSEGNAAIKGLHGKDKGGRKLTVNEARPKMIVGRACPHRTDFQRTTI